MTLLQTKAQLNSREIEVGQLGTTCTISLEWYPKDANQTHYQWYENGQKCLGRTCEMNTHSIPLKYWGNCLVFIDRFYTKIAIDDRP